MNSRLNFIFNINVDDKKYKNVLNIVNKNIIN